MFNANVQELLVHFLLQQGFVFAILYVFSHVVTSVLESALESEGTTTEEEMTTHIFCHLCGVSVLFSCVCVGVILRQHYFASTGTLGFPLGLKVSWVSGTALQ